MNIRRLLVLPALLALVVPVAIAGGDHYACTKGTQECLDMMAEKYSKKGYLGIEAEITEDGKYLIKSVLPDTPAQAAGFKSGDVIVAVNGVKYAMDNKDALKAVKAEMLPGKKITYTVERGGYDKKLSATLAKVPTQVLAAWVGEHMLEHADVEIAQN